MTEKFYSWAYIWKDENSNLKGYMYLNVHSNIIYNSPNKETTQMPINR